MSTREKRSKTPLFSRRNFLRTSALGGVSFLLFPNEGLSGVERPDPSAGASEEPGFFSPEERKVLARLANTILPEATELGAVNFIERLVTAFDYDPPRIYVSGPFVPEGGTAEFLPLNRVQEKAWRLYLYGSRAVEGGGPNDSVLGEVIGLRDLLKQGVRKAMALLRDVPFEKASARMTRLSQVLAEGEFKRALTQLVVQSYVADPAYGGNRDGKGWQSIGFEGHVMPRGYGKWDESTQSYREDPQFPISGPEPGPDPKPLTLSSRFVFLMMTVFMPGARRFG